MLCACKVMKLNLRLTTELTNPHYSPAQVAARQRWKWGKSFPPHPTFYAFPPSSFLQTAPKTAEVILVIDSLHLPINIFSCVLQPQPKKTLPSRKITLCSKTLSAPDFPSLPQPCLGLLSSRPQRGRQRERTMEGGRRHLPKYQNTV